MDIATAFIAQSRRYLASEYPAKIQRCLDVVPAEAIWRRDDDASNSIGNLLLHLSGNIRQWIVSGVGGAPDARQRRGAGGARGGGEGAAPGGARPAAAGGARARGGPRPPRGVG